MSVCFSPLLIYNCVVRADKNFPFSFFSSFPNMLHSFSYSLSVLGPLSSEKCDVSDAALCVDTADGRLVTVDMRPSNISPPTPRPSFAQSSLTRFS